MNRPLLAINCPECGAQFDLSQAMEDADGRRFVALLTELPPAVIKPLINYLKLFKPTKQGLKWSRMFKLAKELQPMIKRAQVEKNRMTYAAPVEIWARCMSDLVDNPPESLRRPLTGNGYLLSMVANQSDQGAARAEKEQAKKIKERTSHSRPQSVAAFVAPDEEDATSDEAAKGFLKNLLKTTKGGYDHE